MTIVTSPSGRKSRWTMLYNGDCPPPGPEPPKFITGVAGDLGMQMVIDNRGRIYTWGATSDGYGGQTPIAVPATSNFVRHDGTYYETATAGSYQGATLKPIQVGVKSDWVKCDNIGDFFLALDSDGYLWGWGEPYDYGLGGWLETAQYNGPGYPNASFIPGGSQAIIPQLLFDTQWKDFAAGQYHIVAIKPDGSLWVWGTNLDGTTFGDASYVEDYISLVPIEMTWVPGTIKLVAAYWSVTAAVNTDNEVWIWGEWWISEWGVNGSVATPMQLPLSIPAGVQITQIKCSYSGVVVLLSNGDVYAAGYWFGFVDPYSTVLTKDPGNHHFVYIDVGETGAAAIDINGDIWGWGNNSFLIYQPDWPEDITSYIPTLTQPGPYYTHVSLGYWFHQATDNQGRLWTWGRNEDGALGIDEKQADLLYSYSRVEASYFATLDDGTIAMEELVNAQDCAATTAITSS